MVNLYKSVSSNEEIASGSLAKSACFAINMILLLLLQLLLHFTSIYLRLHQQMVKAKADRVDKRDKIAGERKFSL